MNNHIKIAHIADTQVKCPPNSGLYRVYSSAFNNIVDTIASHRDIQAMVVAGDLFEHSVPSDSERRLVYKFISDLCKISTIQEVVIIPGNHDLQKQKNTDISNIIEHNALNIFTDLFQYLSPEDASKLTYINRTSVYESKISSPNIRIKWVGYSLEDDMQFGDDATLVSADDINNPSVMYICVYHAMIREYVDGAKLPIRKDIYNSLDDMSLFPDHSLILAGDIHENLSFCSNVGKQFIYPGSTQQHTHNEGSYIEVTPKGSSVSKEAELKNIKVYDIFDRDTYSISELPIDDNVSYVTINVTDTPNDPSSVDAMLSHITEHIGLCRGRLLNNINVKLPSTLSSVSQLIFNKLKSADAHNTFNISLSYDKIVSKVSTVNSDVVASVIEKVKDTNSEISTDTVISSDNIDQLVLSDDSLSTLFMHVADAQIKHAVNTNDDLPGDYEAKLTNDLQSLFSNELNKVMGGNKRYDISLQSVHCNQFMGIGENNISLNSHTLTRIYGTNGVGKTTLYRLVRWILKGVPFEGMKTSTAVKNAMTLFNIYDIHNDVVQGTLKCDINGNQVIVTRTATRKWKNNVTDEQKRSINWKDYVSTVDRQLMVDINPSNNHKQLTGDSAEKVLELWTGDIDKLMFVDSFTIERMLKGDVSNINEQILTSIGVDYINQLEDNLDNVKSEFNSIGKPTMPKLDMLVKIDQMKKAIDSAADNNDRLISEVNELYAQISDKEANLIKVNQSLINMGNIPALINELRTKTSDLQHKIENYVVPGELSKLQNNYIEPQQPNAETNSLLYRIKELSDIIDEHNQMVSDNNNKLSGYAKQINNVLADIKRIESDNISDIENALEKCTSDISKSVQSINGIYDERRAKCDNAKSKENQRISEISAQIKTLSETIDKNNQSIEQGYCQLCKRPYADDFESHKAELIEQNNQLTDTISTLKSEYQQCEAKLSAINAEIQRIDAEKQRYNKMIYEIPQKTITEYDNFIEPHVSDINAVVDSIINLKPLIHAVKQRLASIDDKMFSINTYINYRQPISADDYPDECREYIISFNNCMRSNDEIAALVRKTNDEISVHRNEINRLHNEYAEKISEYNRNVKELNDKNDEIDRHNASVRDIRQQHEIDKVELQRLNTEIDSKQSQLPAFELLNDRLQELSELILSDKSELNNRIELQKRIIEESTNAKNQIDNYQKMYDNALLYEHNQLLYKIYSKIIKNNFKDVVFEYYRGFLNNTLDDLLDNINFKLFWNEDSELYLMLIQDSQSGSNISYIPVSQASGMQSIFAGLSLIYTMSILNVKNTCDHIFIDELSGALNKGDIKYSDKQQIDYQNLFAKILHKFNDKSIFVIDHNVKDMNEDISYLVTSESQNGVNKGTYKKFEHKNVSIY